MPDPVLSAQPLSPPRLDDLIKVVDSVSHFPNHLWQGQSTPFMQRAFWLALEDSDAVGQHAGWYAQHLMLYRDDQPIAALPLFAKTHNRGEYVFDHAWAQAYARHGLEYYPRLVTSVPFTPVTGSRILLADGFQLDDVLPQLLQGIKALAQQMGASSWHGLFLDQSFLDSAAQLEHSPSFASQKLARRSNVQFLWENKPYTDFADFLSVLTAKRRKSIRVERDKVTAQGISCRWLEGGVISEEDWFFFYRCYQNTYHIRGQKPYLRLDFFKQLGTTMPDSLALNIAYDRDQAPIAAALFFKDEQTLYGRYWGTIRDVDSLHFEVCYYQGIEYAICNHLRWFDPGTQGEHKLIRGFAPVYTHSLHWLAEPAFMDAVSDFVVREREGVKAYFEEAVGSLPFKQV
ncbi:GNAT family N-acetyltransferase [Aquirhabdus sp.]|uniref:GNAT family N-acetyltransferase n=1 Tax=Aquirhabdus sp. TaxID=2824160 RepID=UPI00396C89FF